MHGFDSPTKHILRHGVVTDLFLSFFTTLYLFGTIRSLSGCFVSACIISWAPERQNVERNIFNLEKFCCFSCQHDRIITEVHCYTPIPVTAWSKEWVCGSSIAGIVGSKPVRTCMSVCCDWCVLSGRGAWNCSITLPGESGRMACLNVIAEHKKWAGVGPLGAVELWKTKIWYSLWFEG